MNHHFPFRPLTISSIEEEETTTRSPQTYDNGSSSLTLRIDVDAANSRRRTTITTNDDEVIKLRPWQLLPKWSSSSAVAAAIVIKPSDDDDDDHDKVTNKKKKVEYDDTAGKAKDVEENDRRVLPLFVVPESFHDGYRIQLQDVYSLKTTTTTTRWYLRIDGDDTTAHTTTNSHHDVITSPRPCKLLMRKASSSVTSDDDDMNQDEGIEMNDHDDHQQRDSNMIPITPSPFRCIRSADDDRNMWWLSTPPPPPMVPSPSLFHYHQVPSSLDRHYPQLLLPHL